MVLPAISAKTCEIGIFGLSNLRTVDTRHSTVRRYKTLRGIKGALLCFSFWLRVLD